MQSRRRCTSEKSQDRSLSKSKAKVSEDKLTPRSREGSEADLSRGGNSVRLCRYRRRRRDLFALVAPCRACPCAGYSLPIQKSLCGSPAFSLSHSSIAT